MSRREYKVINRRLQRGRISSVKEGKYVGGIAPFGYDRVKIKNGKGIAFTIPMQSIIGVSIYQFLSNNTAFLKEGK